MFLSTTRAVIPPRAAEGATIWPVAAPPTVLLKMTLFFLVYKIYFLQKTWKIQKCTKEGNNSPRHRLPSKSIVVFMICRPFFSGLTWCIKFCFSNEGVHFIVSLGFHELELVQLIPQKKKKTHWGPDNMISARGKKKLDYFIRAFGGRGKLALGHCSLT